MENYQEEQHQNEEGKIDLFRMIRNLWNGFKRYWWVIPIVSVFFGFRTYRHRSDIVVPSYQANATFIVSSSSSSSSNEFTSYYYSTGTAEQITTAFPYIIQSQVFQEILSKKLEKGYVNGSISFSLIPNSDILTITVNSNDSQDASEILGAVIENYPQVARYVIGDTELKMLQPMKVTELIPTQVSSNRALLSALLKGAILGCIPLLLYAFTRNEIHSKEDLKKSLSLPCLGTVTKIQKKKRTGKKKMNMTVNNPKLGGAFVENFKVICSRLAKELAETDGKVLMVTSTHPEEGKSMVSTNIAYTLAAQGNRVVLVDADLRKDPLQKQMEVGDFIGGADLKEVLTHTVSIEQMESSLEKYSLYVITSKAEYKKPAATLRSQEMKDMVQALREITDYIIIDTPPVGLMADAMIVSEYVDGAVYIIRQGYTNKNHIRNGLSGLAASNVKLYGCVLNYATERSINSSYYHKNKV